MIRIHALPSFIALFIQALMMSSCGVKEETKIEHSCTSVKPGNVIIDGIDWKDINEIDKNSVIYANSKTTGYLFLPEVSSRCVAFLVSPNIIMTNAHCVSSARESKGATLSFSYIKGNDLWMRERYRCDQYLGGDEDLDFAFLKCENNPGDVQGWVKMDFYLSNRIQNNISKNTSKDGKKISKNGKFTQIDAQQIYLIHQNCDHEYNGDCEPYKKYSPGIMDSLRIEQTREKQKYEVFHHKADTLGGSSGSPVFSYDNHRLIAIHRGGYVDRFKGRGRGEMNFAVSIKDIFIYMQQKVEEQKRNKEELSGDDHDEDHGHQEESSHQFAFVLKEINLHKQKDKANPLVMALPTETAKIFDAQEFNFDELPTDKDTPTGDLSDPLEDPSDNNTLTPTIEDPCLAPPS